MMRKYLIAQGAEKKAETPKQGCIHRTTGREPDILTLSADLLNDLGDSALSGIVRE
jgi:hypothetical protein